MEYFPLGLAEGSAFCNRTAERKKLQQNIEHNRSSIVISPRRYGKTSLILYLLEELKLPYKRIDLFVALDQASIAREIIDGVTGLINQLISKPEQIISLVKDSLKSVNTQWLIGTNGVNVQIASKEQDNDAAAIRDILIILDKLLQKKKKKAVFFIDEFQEIGVIASTKGIEGAIRSVAEKSQHLVFIFSGSNRHILSTMFDDRARPLYMLCDRITLARIHESDYINFINKIAIKRWGKALSNNFYRALFATTQSHPYYVNLVCGRLYASRNTAPSAKLVHQVWQAYLLEEKSKTAIELSKLTLLQKKLIILIAQGQSSNLTSKHTLQKLSVSSATVIKGLRILVEKDYLYELKQSTYAIVDPLISTSVTAFFPHDGLI